jgi:hypothetical protein
MGAGGRQQLASNKTVHGIQNQESNGVEVEAMDAGGEHRESDEGGHHDPLCLSNRIDSFFWRK